MPRVGVCAAAADPTARCQRGVALEDARLEAGTQRAGDDADWVASIADFPT